MASTKDNTTPANDMNASTATATPVIAKMATAPVLPAATHVATKRVTKPRASPVKAAGIAPVNAAATKAPVKTPAEKAAVKAPKQVKVKAVAKPKAEKPAKAKKPKLVRDSFTLPKAEYSVLDDLKQRAGKLANSVKKSEFIRAGIKALAAMSDSALLAAVKAVPAIKTGRPSKTKAE
jgi:hypothetical protein